MLDAALGRYPGLGALVGKLWLANAGLILDPEQAVLEREGSAPGATPSPLPAGKLAEYTGQYADPGTELVFSVAGDLLR